MTAVDTIGRVQPRLPDLVAQLAAERRLGALRSVVRPGGLIGATLRVLMWAAYEGVFLLFLVLSDNAHAWLLWALAVGTVVLLVVEYRTVIRSRSDRVYEFEHGLVYVEPPRSVAYRFEDITVHESATWLSGAQGSGRYQYVLDLVGADGRRVGTESLNLAEIRERITDDVVARGRAALARGESVTFGSAALGPDGLVVGDDALTWAEIDRVERNRQGVSIFKQGRRKRAIWIDIDTVPNADALVQLAARRLQRF